MITDYDAAKWVESGLVMHSFDGPGWVKQVDEDTTQISMALPQIKVPSSSEMKSLKYHEQLMLGALMEMAENVEPDIEVPTSTFVKDPLWSLAPSERDLHVSEMRIRNSRGGILVPTTNPPRPVLHKERWVQEHMEFLSSRSISFENAVSAHAYQIQSCVDWQLGWYLLRGNEKYPVYMNRLARVQNDLGRSAWSRFILPEVEEQSRVHLLRCAATFCAVSMTVRDISPIAAIKRVSLLIETRIATLYSEVIGGFTRSYFRDRNRRTEGERRNELSA